MTRSISVWRADDRVELTLFGLGGEVDAELVHQWRLLPSSSSSCRGARATGSCMIARVVWRRHVVEVHAQVTQGLDRQAAALADQTQAADARCR